MFIMYGLPTIGGVITAVMRLLQLRADKKWFEVCPAREKCKCTVCTRNGLYGCPAGGIFLTESEYQELKEHINRTFG